jgi:hypothetical protein
MVPRSPLPAADLRTAVDWALAREALLFSAGELVVLDRVRALGDDAAELYARLSLRVGPAFRVRALAYACAEGDALDELLAAGLVTAAVPDSLALAAFPGDALREACRRLGLPRSGPRAALEARLQGLPWRDEPVVLVAHRALLARVERLGGFDRSLAPVDRLRGTSWADYTPTLGPGAFPTRGALTTWERARARALEPAEAEAIARAGPPPWGRSPFRYAVEMVLAGDPSADTLAAIPGCAVPAVRALEREGRLAEAVARCRAGDDDPETLMALRRTGRRLARQLGQGWAPDPPLAEPRARKVWMSRAAVPGAPRPLWLADATAPPETVETACIRRVAGTGRQAVHTENWLWTSLFALVFRELYWLPVPGTLPTARRAGPLDLGTPAFYRARAGAADATLARLREEGTAPFLAAWRGERLEGLVAAEAVMSIAAALDGPLVAAVLERLLRRGWAAAHGLPDLLVLPGPVTTLDRFFPSIVDKGALFAEIKGPGDTLRDGQRWWLDQLVMSSIHVEIWMVIDDDLIRKS